MAHLLGAQPQTQSQDWQSLGVNCDSDDGEESYNQMEAIYGLSRLEVWELMIGDSGKLFEPLLRDSFGKRPQGTS